MKTLALLLLLGAACPAAAGYNEAAAALKGLEGKEANDLDGYLLQPGAVLSRSEKATALLADNQPALALFRAAAAEPNTGYLLAPKTEAPSLSTPAPKYGPHVKLFKLALLDAKVKAARGQRAQAEENLLAAAGLIAQLSAQKSSGLLSSMMWQLCVQKAFPVFAESLRDPRAGAAYLKALAAKLGEAAANQDFLRGALAEETEREKNTVRENVTVDKLRLEREKLPALQRYAANKLQDSEFISLVNSKYGAAADARGAALAEAFRANAPAPYEEFVAKQLAGAKAGKEAYASRSLWSHAKAFLGGAAEAREAMAGFTADTLIDIASPAYGKLVPRYHAGLSGLSVLRAALAVKLYLRAKKRLPEGLAQLAPEFLPAVPQDTFNAGAPLSYLKDKKKFKVYSFGPDGKDDRAALELDLNAWTENQAMAAGDIIYVD
ncbi:MAG: hypothetical protein PHV33_09140 [Elusimicrobiales bacterium]|nr:hypothetical protein [Elusimicrobiales bacterium]